MDKLQSYTTSINTIAYSKELYNLPYKLFYIIPTSDNIINDTIQYENITFYYIKFPSIDIQIINKYNIIFILLFICNTIK